MQAALLRHTDDPLLCLAGEILLFFFFFMREIQNRCGHSQSIRELRVRGQQTVTKKLLVIFYQKNEKKNQVIKNLVHESLKQTNRNGNQEEPAWTREQFMSHKVENSFDANVTGRAGESKGYTFITCLDAIFAPGSHDTI